MIPAFFGASFPSGETPPATGVWAKAGDIGTTSVLSVSMSSTGKYQLATTSGTIWVSSNYGANWTAAPLSAASRTAISSDGRVQLVASSAAGIYKSTDYGATWSLSGLQLAVSYGGLAVSANGRYQMATAASGGSVWSSADEGGIWTEYTSLSSTLGLCAMSSTGQKRIIAASNTTTPGRIYVSSVYGASWSLVTSLVSQTYTQPVISSDGSVMSVARTSGTAAPVYRSVDGGNTWTNSNNLGNLLGLASSADATRQIATLGNIANNARIYQSTDSGTTFAAWAASPFVVHRYVAMSANGKIMTSGTSTGLYYYSE